MSGDEFFHSKLHVTSSKTILPTAEILEAMKREGALHAEIEKM